MSERGQGIVPLGRLLAGVKPWVALAVKNRDYAVLLERFLVLMETKHLGFAEQNELALIEEMLDAIEAEHSN